MGYALVIAADPGDVREAIKQLNREGYDTHVVASAREAWRAACALAPEKIVYWRSPGQMMSADGADARIAQMIAGAVGAVFERHVQAIVSQW